MDDKGKTEADRDSYVQSRRIHHQGWRACPAKLDSGPASPSARQQPLPPPPNFSPEHLPALSLLPMRPNVPPSQGRIDVRRRAEEHGYPETMEVEFPSIDRSLEKETFCSRPVPGYCILRPDEYPGMHRLFSENQTVSNCIRSPRTPKLPDLVPLASLKTMSGPLPPARGNPGELMLMERGPRPSSPPYRQRAPHKNTESDRELRICPLLPSLTDTEVAASDRHATGAYLLQEGMHPKFSVPPLQEVSKHSVENECDTEQGSRKGLSPTPGNQARPNNPTSFGNRGTHAPNPRSVVLQSTAPEQYENLKYGAFPPFQTPPSSPPDSAQPENQYSNEYQTTEHPSWFAPAHASTHAHHELPSSIESPTQPASDQLSLRLPALSTARESPAHPATNYRSGFTFHHSAPMLPSPQRAPPISSATRKHSLPKVWYPHRNTNQAGYMPFGERRHQSERRLHEFGTPTTTRHAPSGSAEVAACHVVPDQERLSLPSQISRGIGPELSGYIVSSVSKSVPSTHAGSPLRRMGDTSTGKNHIESPYYPKIGGTNRMVYPSSAKHVPPNIRNEANHSAKVYELEHMLPTANPSAMRDAQGNYSNLNIRTESLPPVTRGYELSSQADPSHYPAHGALQSGRADQPLFLQESTYRNSEEHNIWSPTPLPPGSKRASSAYQDSDPYPRPHASLPLPPAPKGVHVPSSNCDGIEDRSHQAHPKSRAPPREEAAPPAYAKRTRLPGQYEINDYHHGTKPSMYTMRNLCAAENSCPSTNHPRTVFPVAENCGPPMDTQRLPLSLDRPDLDCATRSLPGSDSNHATCGDPQYLPYPPPAVRNRNRCSDMHLETRGSRTAPKRNASAAYSNGLSRQVWQPLHSTKPRALQEVVAGHGEGYTLQKNEFRIGIEAQEQSRPFRPTTNARQAQSSYLFLNNELTNGYPGEDTLRFQDIPGDSKASKAEMNPLCDPSTIPRSNLSRQRAISNLNRATSVRCVPTPPSYNGLQPRSPEPLQRSAYGPSERCHRRGHPYNSPSKKILRSRHAQRQLSKGCHLVGREKESHIRGSGNSLERLLDSRRLSSLNRPSIQVFGTSHNANTQRPEEPVISCRKPGPPVLTASGLRKRPITEILVRVGSARSYCRLCAKEMNTRIDGYNHVGVVHPHYLEKVSQKIDCLKGVVRLFILSALLTYCFVSVD